MIIEKIKFIDNDVNKFMIKYSHGSPEKNSIFAICETNKGNALVAIN